MEVADIWLSDFIWSTHQSLRGLQRERAIDGFWEIKGLPEPLHVSYPCQGEDRIKLQEILRAIQKDRCSDVCCVCSVPLPGYALDCQLGAGLQSVLFKNPTTDRMNHLWYKFHHRSCRNRMEQKVCRYQEEITDVCEKVEHIKTGLHSRKRRGKA